MKTVALAIAATAMGVAGLSTPALAATPTTQSVKVSYAGLNLNTEEGRQALDSRVSSAARTVCRYKTGANYMTRSRSLARKCYTDALAKAKKQQAAAIEDERRGG